MFNDSKFIQKITIQSDEGLGKDFVFEVDNAQIGFQKIVKRRTLSDYEIIEKVVGYRLVVSLSNRFLSMGNADSELADLASSEGKLEVYATDIGWTQANRIEVKYTGDVFTSVQRQRIIPDTEFSLVGKSLVSSLPDWYKITKSKPAYL
jgi:hypothetical protein